MAHPHTVYCHPKITRRGEAVNFRIVNHPTTKVVIPTPPKVKPQPTQPQQYIRTKVGMAQPVLTHYKAPQLTTDQVIQIQNIRGAGIGRILVILGNGPSIAEIPIEKLNGILRVDAVTINHPDLRLWPTKYWAFCDISQYNRHLDHWMNYTGTILTGTSIKQYKPNVVKFRTLGGNGFSLDLTNGFYIGRSTVYATMQVAAWMDYDRIYILGCDMCAAPDGRIWSYGVNPDVKPETRISRFNAEAAFYEQASKTLPNEVRQKYYFCSSYNEYKFTTRFHYMPHENAIEHIIDYAINS